MSGGSFNYLFATSLYDLPDKLEELADMYKLLSEEVPDNKATDDALTLLIATQSFVRIAAHFHGRLYDVFRSAEYWKSGDFSKEQFLEAVRAMEKP